MYVYILNNKSTDKNTLKYRTDKQYLIRVVPLKP